MKTVLIIVVLLYSATNAAQMKEDMIIIKCKTANQIDTQYPCSVEIDSRLIPNDRNENVHHLIYNFNQFYLRLARSAIHIVPSGCFFYSFIKELNKFIIFLNHNL